MLTLAIIALCSVILTLAITLKSKKQKEETVEVEAAAIKKEEELTTKNTYGLTVDIYKLVRICLNDPRTRQEITKAFKDGSLPYTEIIGAANLGNAQHKDFFSLFVSMQTGKKAIKRNRNGNRISLRMRKQRTQDHVASPGKVFSKEKKSENIVNVLQDKKGEEVVASILELMQDAQGEQRKTK
jgi:hypothetical protein